MTDVRNFLFNSDYPIDKIVYTYESSATIANSTNDSSPGIQIAHGLGFAPLTIFLWSNDSDFSTTNEWADRLAMWGNFIGTPGGQEYDCYSDSTNINIYRHNNSGSSKTVYYRIFCFIPSDESDETSISGTTGTDFILSTDYNYLKLFHSGILTSGSNTYTHNLGYIPRVQIWEETRGSFSRMVTAQVADTDLDGSGGKTTGVHITTTQIIWLNPSTYDNIHYRIYYDS